MSRTTIVLAYGLQLPGQGLRALLEDEPDFTVVGAATDGLEALDLVDRWEPSVLIIDQTMPGLNGLEVVRQISQRSTPTRTAILSSYANEAYAAAAMRNGASGYVLKSVSAATFVQAVRTVAAARRYLSSPLSERAVEDYIHEAQATTLDPYGTLSTREREVLHLAAEGYTSRDIAARLSIDKRTVDDHREHLRRKLGLRNQRELLLYVLRRGLIALEE